MNAQLLNLGSDVSLRRRWFTEASFQHPAKLHLGLLQWIIDSYTKPWQTLLDPMAGSGSLFLAATQQRSVIAYEVEARWIDVLEANAAHIRQNAGFFPGEITIEQRDARQPWQHPADCIVCSPPYGNQASATPNGRRMLPYRLHQLAVPYDRRWYHLVNHPTPGAMGAVSFHYCTHPNQIGHFRGERYWEAMRQVYSQARIALRPGGYLILIVKDHIAGGLRVPTAQQTIALCQHLGFQLSARHQRRVWPLSLWQRRRKEAGLPVVEEEDVLVFTALRCCS